MMESGDITVRRDPFPAESAPLDPAPQGEGMIAILARRWRSLLATSALLGLSFGAAVWFLVEPKYEVAATVHVAPVVRPILFSDDDTDISRQYNVYIATQARALVSPAVIQAAVDAADVRDLPFIKRLPDPLQSLQTQIVVEQLRGTELLRISMTGREPNDLVVFIDSLVRTFLRRRDEEQRRWDAKVLSSLRAEQSDLEARLAAKGVELRELAVDHGSTGGDSGGMNVDTWVTELQRMLTQAQRDLAVAQARRDALDAPSDDPRNALDQATFEAYRAGDPLWQGIQEQIRAITLSGSADEQLGRGPDHPVVRARPKRIAALQEELNSRETELRERFREEARRRFASAVLEAQTTVKVLEEEMDRLMKQRASLARQTIVLEDVRHERTRLEQALVQVRQKIWNVEVEQNRMSRVTMDSPAIAPDSPNIDKRPKFMAAALAFSLLCGIVAAWMRQRLDKSVYNSQDVAQCLGLPLLGSLQQLPDPGQATVAGDRRLIEPVRAISTALLAGSASRGNHSRLITSPTAGSGKSTLAVNLARSLASTDRRVLLIDADNAGLGVTRALELTSHRGLKEWLDGAASKEEVIHASDLENLYVLPGGSRDARFGEQLARRRSQKLLQSLFEEFDEIIVDSAPVLVSSNAVVLATLVDEVVLVLRAGASTREQAQAARRCLAAIGDKLVGVVLNGVDPRQTSYGYYGYVHSNSGLEEYAT